MNPTQTAIIVKPQKFAPEPFDLKIKFKDINSGNARPSRFGPVQLASFMSNVQTLYDHACKAFELEPHQLKITSVDFPNGRWHFNGTGDAAMAVRDTISVAPDFIAGVHDSSTMDQNSLNTSPSHLETIKPIFTNLKQIKRKNRKEYIETTLSHAIGASKDLKQHIKVK